MLVDEDLGWEHPGWTVKGLLKLKLFDYRELVDLQNTVDREISVFLRNIKDADRKERNKAVIAYLTEKGHDSIFYPNTNEPNDGHARPAVCVFRADQIKILAQYIWPLEAEKAAELRSIKRG